MDTCKIRYSEKEIYESKLTPKKFVDTFFSIPPYTSNLLVSAKVYRNYCELTLESRGDFNSSFEYLFQRERSILKSRISPQLLKLDQFPFNFSPDQDKTVIGIVTNNYSVKFSEKDINKFFAADSKSSLQYREIIKAEIGASAEFEIFKAISEPIKYIGECIVLFLAFKTFYEKWKRVNDSGQEESEINIKKDFEIKQIDKDLVAISREIHIPIDKMEIIVKEIRLDGLFMSITTEKGDYSIEFNNANKIVLIRKVKNPLEDQ